MSGTHPLSNEMASPIEISEAHSRTTVFVTHAAPEELWAEVGDGLTG